MYLSGIRAIIAASALVAACSLTATAAAGARPPAPRPIWLGVEEPLAVGASPAAADLIAKRISSAGGRYQRLSVSLLNLAPTRPAKPTDIWDKAYRHGLGTLDLAVRAAVDNHLEPIIMVEGTPAWARAPSYAAAVSHCPKRKRVHGRWVLPACFARDYPNSWAPNPTAIRAIASVLATRYDGKHTNHFSSRLLPKVTYFQAWNEPNLATHLLPQRSGRSLVAPRLYRNVLSSFSSGAKAGGRSYVKVIAAGLGPIGTPGSTTPQQFTRELLCLKSRGRAFVRGPGCSKPAIFDIWAQHPYDIAGTPGRPRDAKLGNGRIADLPTIKSLIARATSLGTVLPRRNHPLWVTEFDWWTNPPHGPHGYGKPAGLTARWTTDSIWRMWSAGVSTLSWFRLRDDPRNWPGGLWYAASSPEPRYLSTKLLNADRPKAVLAAFRWPFRVVSGSRAYAWGVVPCRQSGVPVEVFHRAGNRWRRLARATSHASGVFTVAVPIGGAGIWRASVPASCSGSYRISPEWNSRWR